MRSKHAKAGDVVELRSPGEILATLDEDGRLDGLPFMPEMLAYFGGRYRVTARVERACDTITGPGVRRIPETVVLDDVRCDGSFHGGCHAGCRIYWKEAWLRTAGTGEQLEDTSWQADFDALAARISHVTVPAKRTTPIFRCQTTALLGASERVTRREAPGTYARELIDGSVGPRQFVRVVLRAIVEGLAVTLRLRSPGLFMPFDESRREHQHEEPIQLVSGQLVRIRSKEEIARTLGRNGKNRGLWFDREMAQYCGRTARVLQKVERIIDERTGRMIELKNDCYILDGIVCTADLSLGRRFCPRAIYPYWRTCWLEVLAEVETSAPAPPTAPSAGAPSPPPVAA